MDLFAQWPLTDILCLRHALAMLLEAFSSDPDKSTAALAAYVSSVRLPPTERHLTGSDAQVLHFGRADTRGCG